MGWEVGCEEGVWGVWYGGERRLTGGSGAGLGKEGVWGFESTVFVVDFFWILGWRGWGAKWYLTFSHVACSASRHSNSIF